MDDFTKESLWEIARHLTRDKELVELTLGYIAQGFRFHQVSIRCDAACTNAIEVRIGSENKNISETMECLHNVAREQGWIIQMPTGVRQTAHYFGSAKHYCKEHRHLAASEEEE